jgi:hypothetical protein
MKHSKEYSNQPTSAMALKLLDAVLDQSLPGPGNYSVNFLEVFLKIYESYARALRRLIASRNVVHNLQAQKVFGFRTYRLGEFTAEELTVLLPQSPLYSEASRWLNPGIAAGERGIEERELRFHLGQFVKSRLSELAIEEESRIQKVKSLRICFNALSGICRIEKDKCPNHHYKHDELTKEFYSSMLRTLLLQFNLMSNITWNFKNRSDRLKLQGYVSGYPL